MRGACSTCGGRGCPGGSSCSAANKICYQCKNRGHLRHCCPATYNVGHPQPAPMPTFGAVSGSNAGNRTLGGGADNGVVEFQDPVHFAPVMFADLLDQVEGAFPHLPRHVLRKIVYAHGKNPDKVVDECLKVDVNALKAEDDFQPCSSSQARMRDLGMDTRRDAGDFNAMDFMNEQQRIESKCEFFRNFLPDAHPEFIQEKVMELGEDEGKIQEWLEKTMQSRDYPKFADFLREKEFKDALEPYCAMTAEEFLRLVPNPVAFFTSTERPASDAYKLEVSRLIPMIFNIRAGSADLQNMMARGKNLLVPIVANLSLMGLRRRPLPSYYAFFSCGEPLDTLFLQEFTYLRLDKEIKQLCDLQKVQRQDILDEARAAGNLTNCPICFNEEVLPFEKIACTRNRHSFCQECATKQAKVSVEESRPKVPCLIHKCTGFLTLAALAPLLPADLFAALVKEEQNLEIRQAGIVGLEECPFCSFLATIEDRNVTVFKCLNPKCRQDSCRVCKKKDHSPKLCEGMEEAKQEKARKMLEEKLSTAIIRSCPKCGKRLVKVQGCNHMTCACGGQFCYRCRRDLPDANPCLNADCREIVEPERIHSADLKRAAAEGKSVVASTYGPIELKHDPTMGI